MLGGDQWSKYTTNESEIVDYRKHTEQLHRSPEENLQASELLSIVRKRGGIEYYEQVEHQNRQNNGNQIRVPGLTGPKGQSYVVTNSFVSMMQPKRTSLDIKLYMQLHRKMMRKCVIEQKFEQSLYDFSNTVDRTRKGFRGALCHERSSTNRDIQHNRRMQTESAVFSLTKENQQCQERGDELHIRHRTLPPCYQKPNLMYNIDLYRKNYRKSTGKKMQMCMTVIKNARGPQKMHEHPRKTYLTHKEKSKSHKIPHEPFEYYYGSEKK